MRSTTQRDEHGFFTIWSLGLCVCVLILGGVFIDLWHAFDERRQVAQMVDAAAVAGANRLDIPHYQRTGEVRLANDAGDVAAAFLSQQAAQAGKTVGITKRVVGVGGGNNEVRITGTYTMDLMFSGFLLDTDDMTFSVTSTARPLRAGVGGFAP